MTRKRGLDEEVSDIYLSKTKRLRYQLALFEITALPYQYQQPPPF